MGPTIRTCYKCKRTVDASHLVNALAKHNVFVGVQLAYKVITDTLTAEDERSYANTIRDNTRAFVNLPSNVCSVCRQAKY